MISANATTRMERLFKWSREEREKERKSIAEYLFQE